MAGNRNILIKLYKYSKYIKDANKKWESGILGREKKKEEEEEDE